LLAASLITLLHELAHYGVGFAWHFPGLAFEGTSVPDSAATAGIPGWQRGLKSAAGPLVNWLFVGIACFAASRLREARWPTIIGLVATVRPGLIAAVYLATAVFRASPGADFDEAGVARLSNLPLMPVVLCVFGLVVAVWWFLISRMPRRGRLVALTAVVLGAFVGYGVYARSAILVVK